MRKENTNSVISSLYFLLIDSFGVQNLYVVKTDSLGSVTTELLKSYCYPNPMKQTTQITFSDINLPVLKIIPCVGMIVGVYC